ncbi:MAG: hypothetical protein HY209_03885 [Candidatus Omnitrophica bacterium]|nr:hypothetical protein [Candidatus Omnitrophota bacterium]
MSILKKFSDTLKEVFWIKSSRQKKSSRRRKVSVKKTVKKNKPTKVKKRPAAKPLRPVKALAKIKTVPLDPHLVKAGEITHYFDRIKVGVVKISRGTILIGDRLTIVGKKSKFVQKVWSMQIESQDVKVAKKGQLIGLKVDKPAQAGDVVYK